MPTRRRSTGVLLYPRLMRELPHFGHFGPSILLLWTRIFRGPRVRAIIGPQTRLELRNFALDFLRSRKTHFLFNHILIQVKESIAVTVDCAPVVPLESRSFGQLHPVRNF